MAVCAKFEGKDLQFAGFAYDPNSSQFISQPEPTSGIALALTTPLKLDNSFEKKVFSVHLLSRANLLENDIFQVFDSRRSRRIGWCIPVNALCSTQHDKATDENFLRYAYAALKALTESVRTDIAIKVPELTDSGTITATDLLPESTAVLTISHETLDEAFELPRWIPSLAAFGYYELTSIDPTLIRVETPKNQGQKLNLVQTSAQIVDLSHIHSLYSKAYPFEEEPHFQFFYLYQAIEFLIDLVFRNEQQIFVSKLIAHQADSNKTKDLLESVGESTSEKRRLNLLVATYCNCAGDASDLVNACNDLLPDLGIDKGKSLSTTLYPVRNFLFHRYRSFPTTGAQKLIAINASLAKFIPTLFSKFNLPVAAN